MTGCLNGAGDRDGLVLVLWCRRVVSLKMLRLVTGDELGQREVVRKQDLSLEAQFRQMNIGKRGQKGGVYEKGWEPVESKLKSSRSDRNGRSFASQEEITNLRRKISRDIARPGHLPFLVSRWFPKSEDRPGWRVDRSSLPRDLERVEKSGFDMIVLRMNCSRPTPCCLRKFSLNYRFAHNGVVT